DGPAVGMGSLGEPQPLSGAGVEGVQAVDAIVRLGDGVDDPTGYDRPEVPPPGNHQRWLTRRRRRRGGPEWRASDAARLSSRRYSDVAICAERIHGAGDRVVRV